MKVKVKEKIHRPIAEVYNLVKNELPSLVPYLPNVGRIEKISQDDTADGKSKIVNKWYADVEVPALVSKLINENLYSWKDTAHWDDKIFTVTYSLESFLANDLFEAKGKNTFTAVSENETLLEVECDVKIFPEKVPGVPKFLASKALPLIEKLIEKMLAPNLASLGNGLNDYFSDKKGR